ncbi:MAG: glycosyltransferase family 39 protein, partial [Caldilineaceae bacterium]|nr:glycosyltransferase family 39 protein [Caldilineaceae bacterium]
MSTVVTRFAPRFVSLHRTSLPTWAIGFLAVLTRTWRLNYHSIWFDEAVTLQWAKSDPLFIWQKTFPLLEDKHPPVYYLGLHYWQGAMGWIGLEQNDAALRLFGALLGVVTVWAIMRLASQLSGRAVGLLTGLLVALSPILTWYSQELRMFQPATTGLTVGALCLWQAWSAPTWRRQLAWWLGFVLATTAALYSYLFSAFLLPAAGLTLLLLPWQAPQPNRWRRFWTGVVALGLTGLLFLPLAYNAWAVNSSEGDPGTAFANLAGNLWRLLRIFTIWRAPWAEQLVVAALACFALAILLGLFMTAGREPISPSPPARTWLLLWIGIPLLIGNVLQSRSASVFAEDRYFLFIVPFVLWALARGIVVLGRQWRWVGWGGAVTAVACFAVALGPLWTPALYRENWRAAVAYVVNYHRQSPALTDTMVAHVDYTHLPLEWYLRQSYAFDDLPLFHPYGGTLQESDIEGVIAPPLEGIRKTGAATLWLTQSHLDGVDDARLVEGWLRARFPLVTELYPTGIKLSGFALQSQFVDLPPLGDDAFLPATELAPGVELAACEVLTPIVAAHETIMHPPSGWVHVRLWWQATGPI